MESNSDSPEIPDMGETSEAPDLPSSQKNGGVLRGDFESIKYRWKDRKVRSMTKEKKQTQRLLRDKPWWLRFNSFLFPGNPTGIEKTSSLKGSQVWAVMLDG